MEGTKIKLQERRHNYNCSKRKETSLTDHSKSSHFHSYTFRFDKPYRKLGEEKEPYLAITQIEMPQNAHYNTGSSLERWSKKRPRLKSANKPKSTEVAVSNENFPAKITEDYKWEENNNEEEAEIDDDVRELIMQRPDDDEDEEEMQVMRRRQKKAKHKAGECKKKCRKKIRFSLSKPQSPETVQIIRVDVTTTNYPCEQMTNVSEDGDYGERFHDALDRAEEERGNEDEPETDFTIMCKKLTLASRE